MEKIPDIDEIIDKILSLRGIKNPKKAKFSIEEISYLIKKAQEVMMEDTSLLELDGTFNIVGSIFGDLHDLFRTFEYGGLPPYSKYLFLGNYVDRGKYSTEGIVLLLALKVKYPQLIFLLRGAHEGLSVNRIYGFFDECKRFYSVKFWKEFKDVFNYLPLAAVVNSQIFGVNSGISPDLQDLEQIKCIVRPTDVPDTGMITDLLWSTPELDEKGWSDPGRRNVSLSYGSDVGKEFLDKNDLHLMVIGFQVINEGYEFTFKNNKLISLFSTSDYLGDYGNFGAILKFTDVTNYDFQLLTPKNSKLNPNAIQLK